MLIYNVNFWFPRVIGLKCIAIFFEILTVDSSARLQTEMTNEMQLHMCVLLTADTLIY